MTHLYYRDAAGAAPWIHASGAAGRGRGQGARETPGSIRRVYPSNQLNSGFRVAQKGPSILKARREKTVLVLLFVWGVFIFLFCLVGGGGFGVSQEREPG